MKRFKARKKHFMTITKLLVIVFLLVLTISLLMFYNYGKYSTPKIVEVANHKIQKVTYQFFSDLITNDVIKAEYSDELIKLNLNSKEEIISVDYDLERTYDLLTQVSQVLKNGISDFENGKYSVAIYDDYLGTSEKGLVLNVPFFIASNNIFLTSLGPVIPVHFHFTGSLLTNIKTVVTNYGINNALLEIYITVLIDEELITPVTQEKLKTDYDILISAKVVSGKVPSFYGSSLESNSKMMNTTIDN